MPVPCLKGVNTSGRHSDRGAQPGIIHRGIDTPQPECRKSPHIPHAPGPHPQLLWTHHIKPLMRAKEGRSESITVLFPPSEMDVALTFNLSSC